jgi:DNA gyrase subunit A
MNIINVNISDQLQEDYLNYAISTVNRAIPSATDGLKVSHRRIIQTSIDNSFTNLVKTAKISGAVMGSLHPHSTSGPTIQGLADASNYLQPLMDLQGNQGGWSRDSRQKISSDNPASERYTESKLSQLSQLLFDLIISTRPNYDGTQQEVTEYSTALPLSLLNSNSGIGTGYASNSIGFVSENIFKAIVNINYPGKATKSLGVPDIAWNTNILKTSDLLDLHTNGKASINLQGDWSVDFSSKEIIVTKLATGNVDQFLSQVKDCVESEKLTGISSLSDETSKEIKIIIKLKKSADYNIIIAGLLKYTNLASIYSVNSTFVQNGLPKLFTPYELLQVWYQARSTALTKKFAQEKTTLTNTLNLKQELFRLLPAMKQIVAMVLESDTIEQAKFNLIRGYGIDEIVAIAILDISLKQLTKLNTTKLQTEIKQLETKLATLGLLLTDSQVLHSEICRLASNCLQFCSGRVSKVIEPSKQPELPPVKHPANQQKTTKLIKLTKQQRIFQRAQEITKLKIPSFNGLKNSTEEQLYHHLVLHTYIKVTKGFDKRKLFKMSFDEKKSILKKLSII